MQGAGSAYDRSGWLIDIVDGRQESGVDRSQEAASGRSGGRSGKPGIWKRTQREVLSAHFNYSPRSIFHSLPSRFVRKAPSSDFHSPTILILGAFPLHHAGCSSMSKFWAD